MNLPTNGEVAVPVLSLILVIGLRTFVEWFWSPSCGFVHVALSLGNLFGGPGEVSSLVKLPGEISSIRALCSLSYFNDRHERVEKSASKTSGTQFLSAGQEKNGLIEIERFTGVRTFGRKTQELKNLLCGF